MKKHFRDFKWASAGLVLLLLVGLLAGCGETAGTPSGPLDSTPSADPQPTVSEGPGADSTGGETGPYSIPLGNQTIYTYQPDAPSTDTDAVESAAAELAKRFLEDLMVESPDRTFRILRYEDLSVEVKSTLAMDEIEAGPANYNLKDGEKAENRWIVEIHVKFQYEGILDPYGNAPSDEYWVESLHQGSPCGFLLTYEDGVFTLQSRY